MTLDIYNVYIPILKTDNQDPDNFLFGLEFVLGNKKVDQLTVVDLQQGPAHQEFTKNTTYKTSSKVVVDKKFTKSTTYKIFNKVAVDQELQNLQLTKLSTKLR